MTLHWFLITVRINKNHTSYHGLLGSIWSGLVLATVWFDFLVLLACFTPLQPHWILPISLTRQLYPIHGLCSYCGLFPKHLSSDLSSSQRFDSFRSLLNCSSPRHVPWPRHQIITSISHPTTPLYFCLASVFFIALISNWHCSSNLFVCLLLISLTRM